MYKQQSFLKGTAILILANTISKLLGAIFKIPLTYILKEEGMAIFNTSMSVYSTVLTFVISGFPLALSRLIAEEYALKNYITVKKCVKVSTALLCVLGAVGSLFLFVFADFFAYSMKDPLAAFAIKIISPSVFFVAWGTVYKSFYQGSVNMTPTAVSQVIESVMRLIIGFLGAYLLRHAAMKITAAGAISGITLGEIIATAVLFLLYLPSSKALENIGEKKHTKAIIASLTAIAVPMLACSCISSSLSLLDTALIRNNLLKIRFTKASAESFLLKYSSYTTCFDDLLNTLKLTASGARWLYGAYSGYCLTVFHLPTGIIASLGVSVLSLVSGAIAKKDRTLLENTISLSLKLTMLIALPCAFILFIFPDKILSLLFNNTASQGLLRMLSPCLVFVCVSELFTVILHASGHIIEPFLYSLIGISIKLLANTFLIPIPEFNIYGALLGSNAAFFVMMILNMLSVKKHLDIKLHLLDPLIKPLLSAGVMSIICLLLYEPTEIIFKNDLLGLTITLFIAAITYLLMLLSTNAIDKKEFKSIHI